MLGSYAMGHVKTILGHQTHPPEALTAKYYQQHTHDPFQIPACAGGNASVAAGVTWCAHDLEYPLAQIEHAIKYHYHAVASIYKVSLLDAN